MSWIPIEEKYPPQGLQVLVEASGYYGGSLGVVADHSFYIGSWVVPEGEEGDWVLWDNSNCNVGPDSGHIFHPKVHAWMPLPKHYQPNEMGLEQEPDLMEHRTWAEQNRRKLDRFSQETGSTVTHGRT